MKNASKAGRNTRAQNRQMNRTQSKQAMRTATRAYAPASARTRSRGG